MESCEGGQGNRIDARTVGNVVQSRDIYGGIHFHGKQPDFPCPRMLPAPTPHFTDRTEPLRLLTEARARAREEGLPLLVLCVGPGGIGKSELAAAWLWRIREEFPGPQLFADMGDGGPKPAKDVLGRFLRLMGTAPGDVPVDAEEMSGLFRSRLHAEPSVVFLDDVSLASQVRPFLPNSAGSVTVVTARGVPANLSGAVIVPVGAMADEAVWELLERVTGGELDAGPERELLLRAFEGSPFPAHAAATQLALGLALPEYARTVGAGVEDHGAVTAVLNTGYRELTEAGARVYRSLGTLFERHFTADLAAAAAGVADARAPLAHIVAAGLADDLGDGRYRLHALALDHARGLGDAAEREAALRRVVEWYLRGAIRADHSAMPGRWRLGDGYEDTERLLSADEAFAWLEEQRDALRAAVIAASEHGWHDLVVRLVEAQWALCFMRKHHDHWLEVHRHGVDSALQVADRRFLGRMQCQLGFAHLELGHLDEAEARFAAAAEADRVAGHPRGQATAVESQGLLNLTRSGAESLPGLAATDPSAAAEALRLLTDNLSLNLTIAEDADDERAVALAWRHRGRALGATGEHDAAADHLERAIALLAAVPDRYNQAKALTDLGQVRLRAGRDAEAGPALREALALLADQGAPAERVRVLETQSVLAERAGDLDGAAGRLAEALEILEAGKNPRAAAVRARLEELTARG